MPANVFDIRPVAARVSGMNALRYIFLPLLLATASSAETYQAVRLNNGKPLISRETFTDLNPAFKKQGSNINGPSVIRVPDWMPLEKRADPKAEYYLYFGHHGGKYIRMAWAEKIAGPYSLFGMHMLAEGKPRGVLDLGKTDRIVLENDLEIFDHIASPDVHVDDAGKRIVMYFHGPTKYKGKGGGGLDQKTFVAFSDDGLDFNGAILPVKLGLAYMRVFTRGGRTYGIASRGAIYLAPENPFTPPDGFDFSRDLWKLQGSGYEDNPFHEAAARDSTRLRHVALHVTGHMAQIFYSRVGDNPERILLTTIDLDGGVLAPSHPSAEILKPEVEWEGSDLPLKPSRGGAQTNVRQLRDPYVFEDGDGKLFLFYSGKGEEGIGLARLSVE